MPPQAATTYPLSTVSSHLLAVLFSTAYVGSLYIAKNARIRYSTQNAPSRVQPGSRDDPAVIRARLAVATISSIFSCTVVYTLLLRSTSEHPFASTLQVLGVRWPENLLFCFQAPLIFLGPLYAMFLAGTLPGQSKYSIDRHFFGVFRTWIGVRNYVMGPLTEEIVFRACVLAVYTMGSATRWEMIAFAPLVFGLAHVHHAWDTYNRYGRTSDAFKRAAFSTLFQTAYTTLFGAYASFLLLRTNSLLPPLVAHIFCNIMGLPQIGDELRRFPAYKRMITAAYIIGIICFAFTLRL
ncbi:hypothetical protein B0H16DRAFT_1518705 [Mycena metata]|uniref:intramembrane prenyl-peptidase Rce1 n=1 Tax=Mycena metata TaxID=1033252 RepID=A0AAD7JS13_9AGAR|nr:hypothetical protein B0H16DRAFT_1518705 [Mycena metata]